MARQSTQSLPDKIHWESRAAFRDSPYRLLHHQRGLIGLFRVRLLEAADLQRSYWSPLALGPVRHLGLSVAHGPVSSFCTFSLEFEDDSVSQDDIPFVRKGDTDKKPAAKPTTNKHHYSVVSPVVPRDNNPVWENCQFEFPLKKGAMISDGMRIKLQVRVDEDSTPVENFLPGVPSGGDARLLGIGRYELTELCLGETLTGQSLPGVRDAWIPISLADQDKDEYENIAYSKGKEDILSSAKKKQINSSAVTGMVRVLVSYISIGLEPNPKDVIALESFARRNPAMNSCRPMLPPLMPLVVIERRGAYLLCEYSLPDGRKACVRLHRNSVFVIERQNLLDAAHNLALLPLDVVASTPVGQATAHALGPVVAAGRELLMPALLSFKLVWMAARTTTKAGFSGMQALGSTLWQEGSQSLTSSSQIGRNHVTYRDDDRRRAATAQFVQL